MNRSNDATRDTTDATVTRQGVSLDVAARLLGVGLRTVQRRVRSGELRSIERDGGRLVLLDNDATNAATVDATRDTVTRHNATGRDSEADLRDTLEREREQNQFLRSVIEQLQRDSAETRAALREALKLAPKQLTTGTEESAQSLQRKARESETSKDTAQSASAPQKPAQSDKRTLTYNDIADELERRLSQ
jgi:excisionase family DNA binding protein